MKATETSRLYNFMKASQLHKQHVYLNHKGRYQAKSPGKKMKLRWQIVQFNPNIHVSQV